MRSPGRDALGDGNPLALRDAERDLADRRLAIGFDHVDEGSEGRSLDGGRRDDRGRTHRRAASG